LAVARLAGVDLAVARLAGVGLAVARLAGVGLAVARLAGVGLAVACSTGVGLAAAPFAVFGRGAAGVSAWGPRALAFDLAAARLALGRCGRVLGRLESTPRACRESSAAGCREPASGTADRGARFAPVVPGRPPLVGALRGCLPSLDGVTRAHHRA
jgi:hypothetical protein